MIHGSKLWLSILGAVFCLTSPVPAADRDPKIQKAIDRGAAFLRTRQGQNGAWTYPADMSGSGSNIGATALVGLTLLECGVPPDDPVVQQAAQFVRQNAPSLVYTYALSTSIWFLDRLGDEADVYIIQALAVRLLAGQNDTGGWTYHCPNPGGFRQDEVRRLMNLNPQAKDKKNEPAVKPGEDKEKKAEGARPPVRELPADIQDQLKQLAQKPIQQPPLAAEGPNAAYDAAMAQKGDNSNTQFAALGLWVARRYGIPSEPALVRIEKRFRATQIISGGWNYIPAFRTNLAHDNSPAMTCAGLIGLAVGHGAAVAAAKENKRVKVLDPDKDNNMQAGFSRLGDILQEYSQVRVIGGPNDSSFYFLWSLERVGEIYGLKTIGRRDWYAWGSNVLLNSQREDGGWYGRYHPSGVDSCFALLFLARANVAKDLSVTLRGKMRDPGTRTLKAGGVGTDALKNKGEKAADSDKHLSNSDTPPLVDPKEKLSPAKTDARNDEKSSSQSAQRMSEELAAAGDAQQADLLAKYKEGKGPAYTQALAGAIPRLKGENKSKARAALAERFTRMTADTLRAEMKDDDPEIRRAASLACAMKDDKSHIPDLIPLLDDPEPLVGRAAHAALKSLSGQDFGPAKDASAKDRAQAMEAWKSWLNKQAGK
jgi:hypothetical protein